METSIWDVAEDLGEAGDDFAVESVPSVPSIGKSKKVQRRADRERRRTENKSTNFRELFALQNVLKALPTVVPSLKLSSIATISDADGTKNDDHETDGSAVLVPQNDAALQHGSARSRAAPDEAAVEIALRDATAVLRAEQPYQMLPEAFGSLECIAVLESMLDRPPKYQSKMLGQELSLLVKVWAFVVGGEQDKGVSNPNMESNNGNSSCNNLAIVDIGAGNGCLALLAAILLGGYAVLIDHTLPPDELRVELKVPEPYRSRILRITGDIADIDICQDVEPLLERHGVRRAVVIAKHLCGVGTDLAIDFVSRWQCGHAGYNEDNGSAGTFKVKLLGAAFATCCGHKIGATDRNFFARIHAQDVYLQNLTNGDATRLLELLTLCTRCIAWRTTANANGNRITALQVRAAELFEDVLQQPRLNLLRKIFPAATEVVFVPPTQSPQNRCLLAGTAASLELAQQPNELFFAALVKARDELVAAIGGPLDLKPRGFVSSKYEYDGT